MTDQSIETKLAVISTLLEQIRSESQSSRAETKREIEKIQADVSAMKQQSARWKGGIAVLVAVGAFAVGLASVVEKYASTFKG